MTTRKHATRPFSPPRRRPTWTLVSESLMRAVRTHLDSILVLLVIVHLFATLMILGTFASFRTPRDSRVFGQATRLREETSSETARPAASRSLSPTTTVAISLASAALWLTAILKRRTLGKRVFRFLAAMLIPGTLLSIYGLVRLFLAARTG